MNPERPSKLAVTEGVLAAILLVLASVPAVLYAWLCLTLMFTASQFDIGLALGALPAVFVVAGGLSLAQGHRRFALGMALLAIGVGSYFLLGELAALSRLD